MRFCYGSTRIVILRNGKAYKFGRPRLLRTALKIILIVYSAEHLASLRDRFDVNLGKALWKYFWAGFYANRSEMKQWSETQDERFVPVLRCGWAGTFIVQPEAEKVSHEAVQKSSLSALINSGEQELIHAKQYGKYKGQIRLVDYAHFGWRL